jgi:hypothetical protein
VWWLQVFEVRGLKECFDTALLPLVSTLSPVAYPGLAEVRVK